MTDQTATDGRAQEETTLEAWVVVYLKGIAMGAADSVPGVSGGTIALITGIYERLISAIASLDPRAARHLLRVHRTSGRRALKTRLLAMDVPFLIVLGTGVLSALVLVSRVMHTAITTAPGLTGAFFFGLIAASVVVLRELFALDSPGRIAGGVVGFGMAFLVAGATRDTGGGDPLLPVVFGVAAIAVSAMILPGVSGAFFLYLFGLYEHLTGELTAFVDGLIGLVTGTWTVEGVIAPATSVAVAGVGGLLGLLAFARVIRWALDTYRAATLTFLIALMVGSLRKPAGDVLGASAGAGPTWLAGVLVAGGVGGGAVLALDYYTESLAY
ncbi:DUF368 domain-containing protein [Halorhabdus salina]|uniref:DUF368 domain-containing protein n=1 Tax=Halorhabdus salina TaxID=2750670 RepID=UPI00286817AD|nr:DUF368 domain-containing protein [Halorhabdus salina]